jgi:hypothetical protein
MHNIYLHLYKIVQRVVFTSICYVTWIGFIHFICAFHKITHCWSSYKYANLLYNIYLIGWTTCLAVSSVYPTNSSTTLSCMQVKYYGFTTLVHCGVKSWFSSMWSMKDIHVLKHYYLKTIWYIVLRLNLVALFWIHAP